MTESGIYQMLEKRANLAKIGHIKTHLFRHSFGASAGRIAAPAATDWGRHAAHPAGIFLGVCFERHACPRRGDSRQMLSITIERSVAADAPALTRVQIAAFHSDAQTYPEVGGGGPPGYDSVERTLEKIRSHECYTLRHAGQIIGGVVVFDWGQGHFHLDLLYVDPDFHNRGIGTRAVQFIERTYPATTWSLDTPSYAVRNQHFYEKLGYVKVGEVWRDGFSLIAYEKKR